MIDTAIDAGGNLDRIGHPARFAAVALSRVFVYEVLLCSVFVIRFNMRILMYCPRAAVGALFVPGPLVVGQGFQWCDKSAV